MRRTIATLFIAGALSSSACGTRDELAPAPAPAAAGAPTVSAGDEPIAPLPTTVPLDERKVALGRSLFADPILSGDGTVACTTCHLWSKGGADGRALSILDNRPRPIVNTPTIFNVAYNYRFNWNAKFESLEEHIDAPIVGKRVMDARWPELLVKLERSPYAARFRGLYSDGVTAVNVRDVLVVYERSLITPNAPFDRYLRGDGSAIDDDEKEGYLLFKGYGCVSCHQGRNVGGNLVQRMGAFRAYFTGPGAEGDQGRKAVTNREGDLHVFRVPSLRNVALTSPYFHNGSADTLEDAIGVMARHQLGRTLTPAQTQRIAAFLRTLTGELPPEPG